MRRTPRLFIISLVFIFLIAGTTLAIRFAKGYRPSFNTRTIEGTGLLSATSTPKGASVFINDKLTTATDNTLNLPPGEYRVKIAKDGYIPWEKTLKIEAELVAATNTRLFPSVPDLKPLTFTGALNPTPSPDGEKIAFVVENATTETKNGLYVLDLNDRTFLLNSEPRQIARNLASHLFTQAKFTWSPDSSELLSSYSTPAGNESNIVLKANTFNDAADIKDVTAQLPVLLKGWNDITDKKEAEKRLELPELMQQIATQSASKLMFSPDDQMLLYTATASASLPTNLIPPLPASSAQIETRELIAGNTYIYDLEEDKNFLIATTEQNISWYPDSRHVLIVEEGKITIGEYDNTNRHTVYAGPFAQNFAYSWPNGSRLVILSSLNGGPDQTPNLYSINLK